MLAKEKGNMNLTSDKDNYYYQLIGHICLWK